MDCHGLGEPASGKDPADLLTDLSCDFTCDLRGHRCLRVEGGDEAAGGDRVNRLGIACGHDGFDHAIGALPRLFDEAAAVA